MTLKDLQEEGRKEFDKQFSRMVHWHRGEVLIQNATGGFPIAKDENGNYTTNQFDAIKDFIQSQTSLAYELGKKEALQEALQEYADTKIYQWIKEKDKDWEKKTLDEVYELIRQQAIKETLAMVLKEIEEKQLNLKSDWETLPDEIKQIRIIEIEALDSLKQKLLQANPREEIK